jgi:hypothetical protein
MNLLSCVDAWSHLELKTWPKCLLANLNLSVESIIDNIRILIITLLIMILLIMTILPLQLLNLQVFLFTFFTVISSHFKIKSVVAKLHFN